ncbi:type II/IV secretion system protein [Candidatus Kaiserbacteria bacterium]|nr:type II/IV secretion system protein [Candidatus Kaiserbacteria bacterium]
MDVLALLKNKGVVTDDVVGAISKLVQTEGVSYEEAMIQAGISEDVIREIFSEYYGTPAMTLEKDAELSEEILSYVSEESARYYRIVPFKIEDGVLIVASNDPDNLQVREVLNFISTKHNIPYKLVYMLASDIVKALNFYESLSGEVGEALGSLEDELENEITAKAKESKSKTQTENIDNLKEDAPVTKIVATILRYAVDGAASDIHIEPNEEKVVVRFRVDGELQKSLELPKNVRDAVVARVKILASVRLDEKRKPQDGRFSATFDGRKIDFRVSVLPTSHGEKVVMRILDNIRGVNNLEDTGISSYNLEVIRRVIKEPYGIILISGPTGSGKSTTLYSMMDEVDKETKNVLSLEDPVEYNIKNVSQSQVRPEIGYTFAAGLRSALRQDPDIIMVGEIRDKETAQLAIQAALTGHLVLSTIHTNNSIGVIPRLIDMGVDPYLIAPTLKLAIAQRLARRLCPGSTKVMEVKGVVKDMIDDSFSNLPERYRSRIPDSDTMLHPDPTPGCSAGTKGRVAVTETFEITPDIQELILRGGSEEEMEVAARKHGFMTMHQDAIIKALDHTIPYEEMNVFGTKVGLDMGFELDKADDEAEVVGSEGSLNDSTVDNRANQSVDGAIM